MAASTLTTVSFIYKRDYSGRAVPDMSMLDHPLYYDMPKEGGFVGDAHFYSMKIQNDQGIAGTLAKAQANARAMTGKQLNASRKAKYAVITLDGEAMAAASEDKGSFMRLVTKTSDGVIAEVGASFAFDVYRDGTGLRGAIAAGGIAGNVLTLANVDDARNFRLNMTISAAANPDGTGARVGSTFITAISLKNGKITVNNAGAIAALAAGDSLFRDGDICMDGLGKTTPLTEPAPGDAFRGIDRSVFPELLSGVRIADLNTSLEENIGLAAVQTKMGGQDTRAVYANPLNVYKIARRQNAKVTYQKAGGTVQWGFQQVMLDTSAGTLRLVADPDCPTNLVYGVNHESHYIKHLYGMPHIIDDDGRMNLRMTSEDSIETRVRGWVNYVQDTPGDFFVVQAA
jgi:hypothetical protein